SSSPILPHHTSTRLLSPYPESFLQRPLSKAFSYFQSTVLTHCIGQLTFARGFPTVKIPSQDHIRSKSMQDVGKDLYSRSREGSMPQFEFETPPHFLSPEEVISQLQTDPEHGLSDKNAGTRLTLVGLNELSGGGGVSAGRI